MFQDDSDMEDLRLDVFSNTKDLTSLSLGDLLSLVENSFNDALTKSTGWAWKDVDVAIHMHDIVLSLRHMRHGIIASKTNTSESSAEEAPPGEPSEKAAFASLLGEVEEHDYLLARTMRSYLEDSLDALAELRSSMKSQTQDYSLSSKLAKVRKLRNAVHCFALQRDPLQAFVEWNVASNITQELVLEPLLQSAAPQMNTSEHKNSVPDVIGQTTVDSMPQPTIQRTDTKKLPRLDVLIKNSLGQSAFSKSDFLPRCDLDSLIDENSIKRELRKSGCKKDPKLISYIQTHGKKSFAILAYRGLVKYASSLPMYNFTDDYLPIEEKDSQITSLSGFPKDDGALDWFLTWQQEKVRFSSPNPEDSEPSSDDEVVESDMVDWRSIRSFCDTQWIFLAPVFKKGSVFETVYDKCPMPIVEYEQDVASGGFSSMHKGKIHPAHQVGLINGDLIAIKELKVDKSRSMKAYRVELDALAMVQKLNHERIVKFIAGFEQRGQRYLMFQWVDGGNLRDFWENQPSNLNKETVEWALNEIKCLAEALKSWHNYDPDPNFQRFCRHGDLKPENIVRDPGTKGRGKFLIADMGLAKSHTQPTPVRRTPSGGHPGTERYRAPELGRLRPQISRSVDIWSFGCIILEFIIWMLYGSEDLHNFNIALALSDKFYISVESEVKLHPEVERWIDHMMKTAFPGEGPSISGALGDLLRLVYQRLLIKDPEDNSMESPVLTKGVLPGRISSPGTVPAITMTSEDVENLPVSGISRAKIGEVCEELSKIVSNTKPDYVYNVNFEKNYRNSNGPQDSNQLSLYGAGTSLSKLKEQRQDQSRLDSGFGSGSPTFANTEHPYLTPNLSDVWEINTDNQFAKNVFRTLGGEDIRETLPKKTATAVRLCENCSAKDGGMLFDRGYSACIRDIKNNYHLCNLCRILCDNSASDVELTYYRKGSSLATSKNGTPVWSLVVGPGAINAPLDIQRGFPLLPNPGGSVQTELIREWVHMCDSHHSCGFKGRINMPTRLIDLNLKTDPNNLKLDCSQHRQYTRYVALSHRWGDPTKHKSICLLKDNLAQWQRYINLSKLPQTFQDAVKVTRQLGIRYLWIDSLCIVQDSREDWETECQKMEDVFSFAYVTLSATCSSGVRDGFIEPSSLKNFRRRDAYALELVTENRERINFYLCSAIDDFKRDVEDAELSTRGWVFQERALSRRIIHFTQTQLYWECGDGIKSETLNRLSNPKSAFISDPEFPKSMASEYKGMKIEFFKEIYGRYSKLNFTYETDRSLGMAGIERRLERVFEATACYGILNDPKDASYLRRSLLWRSFPQNSRFGRLNSNNAIKYSVDRQVPTWSWMAVKGPIEYMEAPFGEMNWNLDLECASSMSRNGMERQQPTRFLKGMRRLTAFGDVTAEDDYYFDNRRDVSSLDIDCIIVGTEKNKHSKKLQKHYVLLITLSETKDQYERVGVAVIYREASWKSAGELVMVR